MRILVSQIAISSWPFIKTCFPQDSDELVYDLSHRAVFGDEGDVDDGELDEDLETDGNDSRFNTYSKINLIISNCANFCSNSSSPRESNSSANLKSSKLEEESSSVQVETPSQVKASQSSVGLTKETGLPQKVNTSIDSKLGAIIIIDCLRHITGPEKLLMVWAKFTQLYNVVEFFSIIMVFININHIIFIKMSQ